MKRCFPISLGVLLWIFAPSGWADGVIVTRYEDPNLFDRLTQDQQIAVVQFRPDGTAQADLFISLVDSSGQSHEVRWILPFYEPARDFHLAESTLKEFTKAHTQPLDQFLLLYRDWAANYRRKLAYDWLRVGTLFCPPLGAVGLMGHHGFKATTPDAATPTTGGLVPEVVLETEHARVEVYRLAGPDDLAKLVAQSGLPREIKERLANFRPPQAAVVTLHTVASTPRNPRSLGLHLAWQADLPAAAGGRRYVYPLGTGAAWAHPIHVTRLYLHALAPLSLAPEFPVIGEYWDATTLSRYGPTDLPACSWEQAQDGERMVASATYLNVNPAVDVPVQVRPAPEEELARQRMFRQRWCFHRAPLLYGLWGLLSWLVACGVALPRRLGVGRWGTAAVGGLLAYALLPALLALPDLWRAHPMSQAPFDQWLLPARFWLLVPFILFDGPGLWLFCMVSPLLPMSLCYFALSACRAGRLRTVIVLTLLAGTLYLLGGGLILYGMLRI